MSQAVIHFLSLIATLAIFGAMVVAAPRPTETADEQKSSGGRGAADRGHEVLNGKATERTPTLVERTTDIPSRAVAKTASSSDATSRIVVSKSDADIDIALGSSDSSEPKISATAVSDTNDDDPDNTVHQRSARTVSNGSLDDGTTGHQVSGNETSVGGNALATGGNVTVFGGNAQAECNATGGDAVLIISSSDASNFIHNSPGGDFWALLKTLLIQFSDDTAGGRTDGYIAAGGQVLCGSADVLGGRGSRVGGGSAVVFADDGGMAVGGSATVLGVVDGQLEVFCHAAGEISKVGGRVALGGIVTVL